MRIRAIVIFALLALAACDQSPIGPALPVVDSSWRTVRRATWQPSLEFVLAFSEDDLFVAHSSFECLGDVCLGSRPEILHYDGASWSNVPLADDQEWIDDMWGDNPGNIYVAGVPLYRYDGSIWHRQSINARDVTGSSNTLYASYYDTVYRFENSEWDTLRVFDHVIGEIAAGADGSLFVLGYQHLDLWNGTSWQAVIDGTSDPRIVLPFSVTDAFVVVYSSGTQVLHWDGTQLTPTAPLQKYVGDLAGTSSSDVFAMGERGATYHYDGVQWSDVPRVTGFDLTAAVSSGPGSFVAVGESGKVVAYDGGAWQGLREGEPRSLYGIWAETPTRAIISTYGSTFRMDGDSWDEFVPPEGLYIDEMTGTTIDDVYGIYDRFVLHFDGNSWSVDVDSLERQWTMWTSPSGTVYSAGPGSVYRRDDTWQRIYDGPIEFSALGGRGSRLFAVGDDPVSRSAVLAAYDGAEWQTYALPDRDATDVLCASDSEVYAAGLFGLYRLDGSALRRVTPPVRVDAFRSVFELNGGQIVTFGLDWFAYFDGALWSLQRSSSPARWTLQSRSGSIMGADSYGGIYIWEVQP